MAELLTLDLLREVFTKSGESDEIESIVEIKGEPAVGNSENFCSNLYRTRVIVKLTTGRVIDKTLVLKVFLKNLVPTAFKEMKLYFTNEVVMYDKILLHMGKMAQKYNFLNPRLWSNCYFASTDVLVLDDLKEEGFVVPPRHAGLSLEEGIIVMQYLAKLHALSVVADRRGLINPQLIRRLYTWAHTDNWTSMYIQKGIATVGKLVTEWGSDWTDIGKRIEKSSIDISNKLNFLFNEKVKLSVVNHGDSWINNIMIKYNKQSGQPESIKFVDFQNATYNSYAWDLIYFIYSSLQEDIMRNNYDQLLQSYRLEFIDVLNKLNESTDVAPSIEDIKSEIIRLHPFCLAISCTVLAIVFNTADQEIQIDDLTENDEKLRALYQNENFKSTITAHIKYFEQHNVI